MIIINITISIDLIITVQLNKITDMWDYVSQQILDVFRVYALQFHDDGILTLKIFLQYWL